MLSLYHRLLRLHGFVFVFIEGVESLTDGMVMMIQ